MKSYVRNMLQLTVNNVKTICKKLTDIIMSNLLKLQKIKVIAEAIQKKIEWYTNQSQLNLGKQF